MTKMLRTVAALAIMAGLGIGCSKTEEPKPEKKEPAKENKEKEEGDNTSQRGPIGTSLEH